MALSLYEKEVGPKPKKVRHLGFLKHVLFKRKKFGIISKEKYLKEYLLCSQFWGTVLHTIDGVVVNSNSLPIQNNAPNTLKF